MLPLHAGIDTHRTNRTSSGTDTYQFTGQWGKDIIVDTDGKGKVQISGKTLGAFVGVGKRDVYAFDLGSGQYAGLALVQDAGWNAVIVQGSSNSSNSANSITIRNFDRNAAQNSQSPNGYLGIRIPQANQVALLETSQTGAAAGAASASGGTNTGGPSYWSTLGASTVNADGAVITLAEGQVQASFALVSDAGRICKHYRKRSVLRPYDADIDGTFHKYSRFRDIASTLNLRHRHLRPTTYAGGVA